MKAIPFIMLLVFFAGCASVNEKLTLHQTEKVGFQTIDGVTWKITFRHHDGPAGAGAVIVYEAMIRGLTADEIALYDSGLTDEDNLYRELAQDRVVKVDVQHFADTGYLREILAAAVNGTTSGLTSGALAQINNSAYVISSPKATATSVSN